MENILSYIKSLAPIYERRDLLAALNQIQEEHSATVTPITEDVRELLGSRQLRSPMANQYAKLLSRQVNFGNKNPITLIVESLDQLQKNYPFLEKEVRRLFSIQFTTTAVTYERVNILRYIESIAFYLRYSRKFLLIVLAEEVQTNGGTPANWSKASRQWLADNLDAYVGLFNAINRTDSQLKQAFSTISSAEVEEETLDLATKNLGLKGTDPLRLGLFSPQRNIFFAMGKYIAEMQVKRYKAAKDELYALQQRMQELREIEKSGQVKPNLQKFIQVTEERIEKLDFQINSFEEANAYD